MRGPVSAAVVCGAAAGLVIVTSIGALLWTPWSRGGEASADSPIVDDPASRKRELSALLNQHERSAAVSCFVTKELLRLGDPATALHVASSATEGTEVDADLLFWRASSLFALGNEGEALEAYRVVHRLGPAATAASNEWEALGLLGLGWRRWYRREVLGETRMVPRFYCDPEAIQFRCAIDSASASNEECDSVASGGRTSEDDLVVVLRREDSPWYERSEVWLQLSRVADGWQAECVGVLRLSDFGDASCWLRGLAGRVVVKNEPGSAMLGIRVSLAGVTPEGRELRIEGVGEYDAELPGQVALPSGASFFGR